MSNPFRPPKEVASVRVGAPSSYVDEETAHAIAGLKRLKKVETVSDMLRGLDMGLAKTFVVSKQLTAEASVLNKKGPALGLSKTGAMSLRVRSQFGFAAASAAWAGLPEDGPFGKEVVGARMRETFYADGGTENALGRLLAAYPKVGSSIARPVTLREALRALRGSGIDLMRVPDSALRPYPLLPFGPGEGAVTVNPKSDNGFPVLAQWSTPGASELVMGLAETMRRQLVQRAKVANGVHQWKEELEASDPQLVAVRGKAKADYYKAKKLALGQMRFYNALPRQVALNMQVATQVLEQLARTVLEGSNTGIGLSLHYGGAGELVLELDRRLEEHGQAFVHVGDDSWVAVRARTGELVMFALDCSNFDLTQHHDATLEVHKAIRRQLERIDAPAADLWYEYARGRLVVVSGAVTRYMKHAGPSGMPLQSKVNDMLMDVLIERALERPADWLSESAVDAHLVGVGKELGFEVRVEQHMVLRASSIFEALERAHFLFVGYNFFVRAGKVQVMADWARQMAQLPFPGLKWMKTDKELAVMEAMRLGSIVLSMGLPHPELDGAYTALREHVTQLVGDTLRKFGDQEDDRLRWAVSESPLGPATQGSLSGLLRALERDQTALWLVKEAELVSTSTFVSLSWADEVEEEEAQAARRKEAVVLPPAVSAKPVRIFPRPVTTHPATARNDGRPPPTAVWGPNKAPRAPRTKNRRFGRVLEDEVESVSAMTVESEYEEEDEEYPLFQQQWESD